MSNTACIVYEHGSQEKLAKSLAAQLGKAHWEPTLAHLDTSKDMNGFFKTRGLLDCSAIFLTIGGPKAIEFLWLFREVCARRAVSRRPLIATVPAGIVLDHVRVGTYLYRHGADIVFVNTMRERHLVEAAFRSVGGGATRILACQNPILMQGPLPAKSGNQGQLATVLFAVQTDIPKSKEERAYVARRLCEYAQRHPRRTVLIKPKHRIGEKSGHPQKYPYEDIFPKEAALYGSPDNLMFTYQDMDVLLDEADLLVTISSTAALEALVRGRRAVAITDFGVKENIGNSYFLGANILATFDDIIEDRIPAAEPAWLREQMNAPAFGDSLATVEQMVAHQEASRESLPFPHSFYLDGCGPFMVSRFTPLNRYRLKDLPQLTKAAAEPEKTSTRIADKVTAGPASADKRVAKARPAVQPKANLEGLSRYERAQRLLAANEAKSAEKICREALKRMPQSAKHLRQMARILAALGRKEEARRHMKAARAARWRVLGRLSRWLGRSGSPTAACVRTEQESLAA